MLNNMAGNTPPNPSITEEVASNDTNERFMSPDVSDANFDSYRIAPSEDMTVWQNSASWPQPKWLAQTRGQKPKEKSSYRDFYLNTLRSRYLELEADFRTGYNNFYNSRYMDLNTAQIVIGYLQAARKALEGHDGDIYDIVTMLNLADQGMVGLYPPHVAKSRANGIGAELKSQGSPWGDYLLAEVADPNQTLGGIRAALEKTKNAMNDASQSALISTGLQIERLRTAWMWSLIVLGIALCFLPMMVNYDDSFWAKTAISKIQNEYWRPWFVAGCMAIFGVGGAFFSSLMQVRTTKSSLSDFQEKQKDSQLKLAVGAIAALIMFIFLSWQIIPGVELKNAGSFLFLAFVAGFSERYFLRILNIEDENATPLPDKPAPVSMERPPIESQTADDVSHSDVSNEPINQPANQ
jgi:hypothetical protein